MFPPRAIAMDDNFALLRCDADGALDAGFGDAGAVIPRVVSGTQRDWDVRWRCKRTGRLPGARSARPSESRFESGPMRPPISPRT